MKGFDGEDWATGSARVSQSRSRGEWPSSVESLDCPEGVTIFLLPPCLNLVSSLSPYFRVTGAQGIIVRELMITVLSPALPLMARVWGCSVLEQPPLSGFRVILSSWVGARKDSRYLFYYIVCMSASQTRLLGPCLSVGQN